MEMEQAQQIASQLAISRHRAVPPGFIGLRKDYGHPSEAS
jgi:hypothetical protein